MRRTAATHRDPARPVDLGRRPAPVRSELVRPPAPGLRPSHSSPAGGDQYTNAQTPVPSDSFPGMVGQVTGGNPGTTGVYYDAEYNHNLLPAGTTTCTGQPPGAEVNYFEVDGQEPAGARRRPGLRVCPGSILQLTGNPAHPDRSGRCRSIRRPASPSIPVSTCGSTRSSRCCQAGLQTAWSDKHVAYEILNGPSGNGIDDLFAPEIDATRSNPDGLPGRRRLDHGQRRHHAVRQLQGQGGPERDRRQGPQRDDPGGVPAMFGMNFQTVSTAQKLPVSDGLTADMAGHQHARPAAEPGPDYINTQLGAMVSELRSRAWQTRPRSSCRPSTASRRWIRAS